MKIKKLAIAVTFHYSEQRFNYLNLIASQFHLLADNVIVYIFTNAEDGVEKTNIFKNLNKS